MRAFLKTGKDDILTSHKQQFIALFPEWSEKFFEFDKFISTLVELIAVEIKGSKGLKESKNDIDNNLNKLVINLAKTIKKEYSIITKDYDNIIRNYINNPEYAFIYMHLIK